MEAFLLSHPDRVMARLEVFAGDATSQTNNEHSPATKPHSPSLATLSKRQAGKFISRRGNATIIESPSPSSQVSPGISKLWKPYSSAWATPRRDLYTSFASSRTATSGTSPTQRQTLSFGRKDRFKCRLSMFLCLSFVAFTVYMNMLMKVVVPSPDSHQFEPPKQTTPQRQEQQKQKHVNQENSLSITDSVASNSSKPTKSETSQQKVQPTPKENEVLQAPTKSNTLRKEIHPPRVVVLSQDDMDASPRMVIQNFHDGNVLMALGTSKDEEDSDGSIPVLHPKAISEGEDTNVNEHTDDKPLAKGSSHDDHHVATLQDEQSHNGSSLLELELNNDEVGGDGSIPELLPIEKSEEEDKGAYNHTEDKSPANENGKEEEQCLPLGEWQTQSFLNCNTLHEVDMKRYLTFLGQGWFRSTWKVNLNDGIQNETMVLKTLRLEREFLEEYYELHRRDAVAMERLTFSPYVMDVYGYCGQSALNEIAGLPIRGGVLTSLEELNRRLRPHEGAEVERLKLKLALSVSLGLSHVHYVNQPRNGQSDDTAPLNNTDPLTTLPAMAHYDVNPRNIAIVKGGKPKLNDFNIAEFLTVRQNTTNANSTNRCGMFRSRLHEPWWRAPEEMDMTSTTFVDEKVDVYALGGVLYHIWTTHSPTGKMKRYRMDEVRAKVRQGIPPRIPEDKGIIGEAFTKAMKMCLRADPKERADIMEVTEVFLDAVEKVRDEER